MTYHPPYDNNVRLRMRRAHATHAYYCSCGKVVHGNGGKAGHAYMHEQRADGHRFISGDAYSERFPEKW